MGKSWGKPSYQRTELKNLEVLTAVTEAIRYAYVELRAFIH